MSEFEDFPCYNQRKRKKAKKTYAKKLIDDLPKEMEEILGGNRWRSVFSSQFIAYLSCFISGGAPRHGGLRLTDINERMHYI